jgi:hypothetical protein
MSFFDGLGSETTIGTSTECTCAAALKNKSFEEDESAYEERCVCWLFGKFENSF